MNTSILDTSSLKVRKVNRTRSVIGEFILYEQFGDETELEVNCFVKQGGGYNELPYKLPKSSLCPVLRSKEPCYQRIVKASDLPEDIRTQCVFVVIFKA